MVYSLYREGIEKKETVERSVRGISDRATVLRVQRDSRCMRNRMVGVL